jgi:hypothetical protein
VEESLPRLFAMTIHVIDDLHTVQPSVVDPEEKVEGAVDIVALLRSRLYGGASR